MRYAQGKHSLAICDRCGHRVRYLELVTERQTKLRVCPDCEDDPEPRRVRKPDAEALRHPRPDPES